ncbi:MAG: O-antigen ligase family protein, partial [Rikenellaceae bacterium]|nr:O-antigen ligase family protein [Rikenellaceae bacterium]
MTVALWIYTWLADVYTDYHYLFFSLACFFLWADNRKVPSSAHHRNSVWLIITAVLECGWAWYQYFRNSDPQMRYTVMTGSFENTIALVVFLVLTVPFLFAVMRSGTVRWMTYTMAGLLAVISLTVIFTGSRTGILALILVVSYLSGKTIPILMTATKKYRWAWIGLILLTAVTLMTWKRDSAFGRILTWKVTAEMIRKKPLLGHGLEAFKKHYMVYQAHYLKTKGNPNDVKIADNLNHPFNEYLKIVAECGFVIALLLAGMIFFHFKHADRSGEDQITCRSILLIIGICSIFSYPLRYPLTWLALGYSLSRLSRRRLWRTRLSPAVVIPVFILLGSAIFLRIILDYRWNECGKRSVQGDFSEELIQNFEKLYRWDRRNPYHLYNYAATLYYAEKHEASLSVIEQAEGHLRDYN